MTAAVLRLRLDLDRCAGEIVGGGLCAAVDPNGDVLKSWCSKAERAGIDLAGVALEMWDRGCLLGDRRRTEPLLCLTVRDAGKMLHPSPKKEKTSQ